MEQGLKDNHLVIVSTQMTPKVFNKQIAKSN